MTPVKDRLESALRLLAAGICVCSVGLLSSLTVQSPLELPLPTVFFLVVSAGCAFIVFAGGLGATTAGGLGGVIAISISIAMANASQISPIAMTVFTMLTITVLVVVGRIAGGSKPEAKARPAPEREQVSPESSRLHMEYDTPIWETTGQRPETSALMGLITQDFCNWLSDPESQVALDEEAAQNETLIRLNTFAGGPLRQRLHARHVAVGTLGKDGRFCELSEHEPSEALTISPVAQKRIATEQPFIQDTKATDLASRDPQWVLPIPGKPTAALCVFGLCSEQVSPRAARSLTELLQLFAEHLRGLKALREARASFDDLATSFTVPAAESQ